MFSNDSDTGFDIVFPLGPKLLFFIFVINIS
jgi:hypothetical protein